MPIDRFIRLTAAGRKVFWEGQVRKSSMPMAYLRLLGLVEFQGHANVIRGYLRRYPDMLIDEWLAEVEELGLIESMPDQPSGELSLGRADHRPLPPLLEEDRQRLDQEASAAGRLLGRTGVYIAEERVSNRPANARPPGETQVLVVEDDPDQAALAELRVSLAGYAVRTADTAAGLLKALQQHGPPGLLLLDVMLPDGDGFDILADLRRHPGLALLPIVMLTVKDEPADIQKGLALGADGYITKPYSKAILADTIRRVLRQ